jgi:hypothetical protein
LVCQMETVWGGEPIIGWRGKGEGDYDWSTLYVCIKIE